MLGFLDTLCGPRAAELKVKDMNKYAFDPRRLLTMIMTIMLQVWRQERGTREKEGFAVSLALHPDFSEAVMTKCSTVLHRQQLLNPQLMNEHGEFMKQV